MGTDFISKFHIGTLWRIRLINTLLNINSNDVVLDAGCGDGFISFNLSKRAKRVIGADISKRTIKENSVFSNKQLIFKEINLNNLYNNLDFKFNKIICTEVLEHAFGFKNIIKNFSQTLKKEGELLITIPIYEGHGHFKYNDFGYIKRLFKKEDLKIKVLKYIQMPFFTKQIHNIINFLRNLTFNEMGDVDSFEQTTSFALKKKETMMFKIYKIFFSIISAIRFLDTKNYREGKDFILIIAKKN